MLQPGLYIIPNKVQRYHTASAIAPQVMRERDYKTTIVDRRLLLKIDEIIL